MISGMVARPVWQICRKGNNLRVTMRKNMPRKTFEGGRTGAARIDNRRDARVNARNIGVDAEAGEALENVSVQIDQARRDDATVRRR